MGFPRPCCPTSEGSLKTSDAPEAWDTEPKSQESKCLQKHGAGICFVSVRGIGEYILDRLTSLCCAHSLCISFLSLSLPLSLPLSHKFHSIICPLPYITFSLKTIIFQILLLHLIFSFSSDPSIRSLLYSHPAMNQDFRTALSPERVWEQKYASHLKMTSSIYAAANQKQAHGTLPWWTHYVHKTGKQRCRIRDKRKTNCKMRLSTKVALDDCVALVSNF